MAYAFCLAGKAEKCELFLEELQKSAKEVGEFQSFWDFGNGKMEQILLMV